MSIKLEDIGFYTLSNDRALNVSATSQMQRCEMIINEYCNFKCSYCRGLDNSIFADRKRKELTFEEIKHNIDLWCAGPRPLKNIRFSGGEPTFHRNIVDIVKYAKEKGIERIAISTNGSNKPELYKELVGAGCNDFSISLDASDAVTGDFMAGNIIGSWNIVVENIRMLSTLTYVTVGVVLEPDNVGKFIEIVRFASSLGVADVRVIPSAQWNQPLHELTNLEPELLEKHPILKYRVNNFIKGRHVRGLKDHNIHKCPLVIDDSVIAGQYHFPCVIYMREQGAPIGKISDNMRRDRIDWFKRTDTHSDSICRQNCLDVCVDYNTIAMRGENINDL